MGVKTGDLVVTHHPSDNMFAISKHPGLITPTNPRTGLVDEGRVGLVLAEAPVGVMSTGEVLCLFGDQVGWIEKRNVELVL